MTLSKYYLLWAITLLCLAALPTGHAVAQKQLYPVCQNFGDRPFGIALDDESRAACKARSMPANDGWGRGIFSPTTVTAFTCTIPPGFFGTSRYYNITEEMLNLHEATPAAEGEEGNCGYIDETGKLVIGYQYDFANNFSHGYAVVTLEKKRGVINAKGEIVIPIVYDNIAAWPGDTIWTAVVNPDSMAVVSTNGKTYHTGMRFEAIPHKEINRIVIINYTRNGDTVLGSILYDYNWKKVGETKQAASYCGIGAVQGKLSKLYTKALWLNGSHYSALTNLDGQVIFDSLDYTYYNFTNGYMPLRRQGKACVINTSLKEVIPFSAGFGNIRQLENYPGYFYISDTHAIVDAHGKTIFTIPEGSTIISADSNKFVIAQDEASGTYTYYTLAGRKVIESKSLLSGHCLLHKKTQPVKRADDTWQLWNGHYLGKPHTFISTESTDGYFYFYDKGGNMAGGQSNGLLKSTGEVALRVHYQYLSLPSNGVLIAGDSIADITRYNQSQPPAWQAVDTALKSRYFLINLKGLRLTKDNFISIRQAVDGQFVGRAAEGAYLLGNNGWKTQLQDNEVRLYEGSTGLTTIFKEKKGFALVNRAGKIISPWVDWLEAREHDNDVADDEQNIFTGTGCKNMEPLFFSLNGRALAVNNGLMVFNKEFDEFSRDGYYSLHIGRGLMDTTGKVIVKPVYDRMEFVDGNFYKVAAFNRDAGDKIGILGKDGAIIIKPSRSHSHIEYYKQYKAFIMLEEDGSWRVLKYTFR